MPFISPMLAAPMPEQLVITPGRFCADEKWDGYRLIVEIGGHGPRDLFTVGKTVRAWTREGLPQILPRHLSEELGRLPECILDGEWLSPEQRSYGVRTGTNFDKLQFIAFDILSLLGEDVMDVAYHLRCKMLSEIFDHPSFSDLKMVRLSRPRNVESMDDVRAFYTEVRQRNGEGLVVKVRDSHYYPGRRFTGRNALWIKVKQKLSARLQIIGWEYGKNGPYSRVKLEDEDGAQTTVKIGLTAMREAIAKAPDRFLGRWLMIEYTERTPDSSYREPRWDHLED